MAVKKKVRAPGRPGRPLAKKNGAVGRIGKMMQDARLRKAILNQDDLVKKARGKVSLGDVRAAENGDPRMSVFLRICEHLQVDPVAIVAAAVN